jgi:hypothetical protein
MRARPRKRLAELRSSALPTSAGVYALWRGSEPMYIGKAKSLSSRLGKAHRGRGVSMTNSALRRNVAEHLGIAAANDIKTGRPVARPEADQVNAWLDDCEASWLVADDEAAALALEEAFKREWLPPLTKQ